MTLSYHVITCYSTEAIITEVQEYLNDGWEPIGGVTVAQSGSAHSYTQTLVKKTYDSVMPIVGRR